MSRNTLLYGVALVFLGGLGFVGALTKPTSIKLIDNAYTGIVVAIHRDVPENQNLVNIIKDMFIEGSLYLYNATKHRAYFDEVTILIPTTWSTNSEYRQASNESFDLADVIVAPPNPRWAPDPYTKQYQGCGKEGVHIHFWDQFLLEPSIEDYYGPLGRVLVHEWGHYRWGLFDEYADPVGDPDNYQEFYYSYITQQWEGVRCSYDYNGTPVKFYPNYVPNYRACTGNSSVGYEDGCVYLTLEGGHNTTGSIMFGRQYYDQIVDFCDNNDLDRPNFHNSEAPNKHNRLCEQRSAWTVMRKTADFADENNSPRDIDPVELIPTFILMQHINTRVVMVLDVSGSMNSDMKFAKMRSAAANYISFVVIEGSRIGIVQFEAKSTILSNLVTVYSESDRTKLLNALPVSANGATCIGCGLNHALEVLTDGGRDDPAGGIILLLSDGDENRPPYIDDVKDSLVDAGVIVDTIAFTQLAEKGMYNLAILTGGKPYFYSNKPGDNTLYDAFAATMERGEIDDHDRRVQLLGNSWQLQKDEIRSDGVFLDYTVGRKTEFSFQWTTTQPLGIETSVIRPNGTVLDETYEGYTSNKDFKLISFQILDTAEPGSWSFTVKNTNPQQEEVFFTVTSYATDPNVEPILVTSELSGSTTDFAGGEPIIAYAEVRQGFSPVIYAEVWAQIDRPGGYSPVDIQLLDNGAGADITKYDGVYSRYFTQFTTDGFYGIKITVVNNGTAIVLGESPFSRAIPNLPPDQGDNPPKVGNDTVKPPWTPPAKPTGEPAPKFTRGISGGSSSADVPDNYKPGDDCIPPGRIIDLRVTVTSFEEATVMLSWSSPGDDLDYGAVQYYDIRRAGTIPELQDKFADATPIEQSDLVIGNLTNPQEFGNIEQFVIRVPVAKNATTASYAFAIQSWDDASPPKYSDVSNVVQAVLRKYIPPTGAPPTIPSPTKSPLSVGAIVGIVIGVVVGLTLIVIIGFFLCRRSETQA